MAQATPTLATPAAQPGPSRQAEPTSEPASPAPEPHGWERPGTRRPAASPQELHDRRKVMLQLLASGIDGREIVHVMTRKHGMTATAVKQLRVRMERELCEEDREMVPLVRAKQVRRLHAHIARAVGDKSWNAVASLERLLAGVRGTLEPVLISVNVDATVREAVTLVLGSLDQTSMRALIDGTDLHGRSVLDTTSEPADPSQVEPGHRQASQAAR